MKQSGNILFLILIAVALFAALSYAVTKSTSGGGNANAEKLKLGAAEIVQHSSSVAQAVMRMKLIGNVDDNDFCFTSEQWDKTGSEYNTYKHAQCSDTSNHVFHSDGGGVAWSAPDDLWMSNITTGSASWAKTRWIYTGDIRVMNIGTTEPELIAFLGPVKHEICEEINSSLGLSTNFSTTDYVCCGWDVAKIFGISSPDHYNRDSTIGDQNTAYAGVSSGCALDGNNADGDPLYYYWHVLIAR